MITKILCPLDLSEFSTRAFEHAIVLGRWYGADVVALHVFATLMPPGSLDAYPGWMRQVPEARELIDRELQGLLAPARAAGVNVPLAIREGDPAAEVLAQAASMPADLIVLSTHGRSGFDRFALGSVAEKVLRKAACPVLIVPAQMPPASQPFSGYRRIVCAIDFSDCALEALSYALSIARAAKATVTLVHVVEVGEDDPAIGSLRDAQIDAARKSLDAVVQKHGSPGASIDAVVVTGSPHRELLRVASERNADLVVMGVRGRGAVDLTLFGSTTNQVVRRATCAVLTVRTR